MSCLGRSHIVGEFHIRQRIILISNGRPTDFTSVSYNDDDDAVGLDEVNTKFFFKGKQDVDHLTLNDQNRLSNI